MTDQAPPADAPVETPVQAETQTPTSDGSQSATESAPEPTAESAPEPTPEASANAPSEPAEPVSEAAQEATAAEPRSEVEPPEPEPTPRTQGAASAASVPNAVSGKTPEQDRELLKIARAKIQTKKSAKLDKIMTLFEKEKEITNDNVEKLLHCSDATARRYLNELVKQGKIKRVGTTGAGVVYVKA
jgi:hypothetical protein